MNHHLTRVGTWRQVKSQHWSWFSKLRSLLPCGQLEEYAKILAVGKLFKSWWRVCSSSMVMVGECPGLHYCKKPWWPISGAARPWWILGQLLVLMHFYGRRQMMWHDVTQKVAFDDLLKHLDVTGIGPSIGPFLLKVDSGIVGWHSGETSWRAETNIIDTR